jgi:hypothetical protein
LSLFASCGPRGGTDVGNGATVKLNLRGYQKPASSAAAITLASGTEVDTLWIAVADVRLQAGARCGQNDNVDDTIDFDGVAVADLLDAGVLGPRPEFVEASGPHCRLRMDLHPIAAEELPQGAPAELVGHALLIRGSRADGVPFIARSNLPGQLRLDSRQDSFAVADGDDAFIVGFDLVAVVESLELDTFEGEEIVIDDRTEPDIVAKLNKELRKSATLFRDGDDDGVLSAAESADAAALASDSGN